MRLQTKHVVLGLAAFVFAIPGWARTYKTDWIVSNPVTIGSTQVKPGNYQLAADDAKTEISVLQNGKAVAQVSGEWIKLPKKVDYSTVMIDSNKVTQIQFQGSAQAFQPK